MCAKKRGGQQFSLRSGRSTAMACSRTRHERHTWSEKSQQRAAFMAFGAQQIVEDGVALASLLG